MVPIHNDNHNRFNSEEDYYSVKELEICTDYFVATLNSNLLKENVISKEHTNNANNEIKYNYFNTSFSKTSTNETSEVAQ